MGLKERPDLAEFPPISFEEWKEKAEKDLKGGRFEQLTWENEGFSIEAFFTREQVPGDDIPAPGNAPYRRGVLPSSNAWKIRVPFEHTDEKGVQKALESGVQSITLSLDGEKRSTELPEEAFKAERLELFTQKEPELLKRAFREQKAQLPAEGALLYDPVQRLLGEGEWPGDGEEGAIGELLGIAGELEKEGLSWHSIPVSAAPFHNAGSSLVEELAFTLSQAHDMLVRFLENGWRIDELTPRFRFELPTGPLFLPEIAKLRAFRQLWARIVEAYEPEHECTKAPWISANSSWWSLTRNDPYTNMVRKTSEAMAAVIGGCQQLYIHPYDEAGKENSELGLRVARNTHHLLKEESQLDKVLDPMGGSYYLEALTDRIGENAWDLVRELEEQGGFFKALEKGSIQERIQLTRKERSDAFEEGKRSILGVNRFRDEKATPLSEQEDEKSKPKKEGSIQALPRERAAFGME